MSDLKRYDIDPGFADMLTQHPMGEFVRYKAIRAHLLSDEAVELAAAAIRSLPAIPGFDKHKMRKSHGEAYRLIASTAIKAALGNGEQQEART